MARKARFESAGGLYHVINRGNYRSWVFESDGAKGRKGGQFNTFDMIVYHAKFD